MCKGVDEALRNHTEKIKAIAVLIGPGNLEKLNSGVEDAIKLGLDLDVPVVPVAGHDADLLSARSQQDLPFPIMSVRLNDLNTEVVYSQGVGIHTVFGMTADHNLADIHRKF